MRPPTLADRVAELRDPREKKSFPNQFTLVLHPFKPGMWKVRENNYVYQYKPLIGRQRDPVASLIISVLRELRHTNMFMSFANILVFPSTLSPPIWPPKHCPPGHEVKFYTFTQRGEEFPATVPVKIMPRIAPLTIEKVHVRVNGVWIPIKEWICNLPDCRLVDQNRMMQSWWDRNGKTFDIMSLPKELRIMIWERAIGLDIYPLPKASDSDLDSKKPDQIPITLGIGHSADALYKILCSKVRTAGYLLEAFPHSAPEPNTALLRVSTSVYEEALKVGWEGTRKCFWDPLIFKTVMDSQIGPTIQFNAFRRLELNFSNPVFYDFFGVKAPPNFHLDQQESQGHYISSAHLPNLTDVTFNFQSKYDWWTLNTEHFLDEGCQRMHVDWIMTLAYPWVKSVPNVKLCGTVGGPVRTKWENVFAQPINERDNAHDQTAAIKEIFETPEGELPPDCTCDLDPGGIPCCRVWW